MDIHALGLWLTYVYSMGLRASVALRSSTNSKENPRPVRHHGTLEPGPYLIDCYGGMGRRVVFLNAPPD
jgi:hypothetical protein